MARLGTGDRVLVTGGTGFIGSNLLHALSQIACKITAVAHEQPPSIRYEHVEYIYADLTDPICCREVVKGIDYIFHCAAVTSGAAVMQDSPLVHVAPNLLMNLHLFEAAYESDVKRIVWISSGAVYPESNTPVKETQAFAGEPYSKYFAVAHMKRYTETLAELFSYRLKKKLPIVVVRPSNVYGPQDKFDLAKGHVTASLVRKVAEEQDPLEVWGDGTEVRDLIYVKDFITGLLLAFKGLKGYDPVNIGSGSGCSVSQILSTLLSIQHYSPKVIYDTSKPTTIPYIVLDVSKAADILNFRAETDLTAGLSATLAWFKENYGHK